MAHSGPPGGCPLGGGGVLCTITVLTPCPGLNYRFIINIISFNMYFDSDRTTLSFDPAVQADSHSELSYCPTVPPTGRGDAGRGTRLPHA